jgi:hypothetical protein
MNCNEIYNDYKTKCEIVYNTNNRLQSIPTHNESNIIQCIEIIKTYSICYNDNKKNKNNEKK